MFREPLMTVQEVADRMKVTPRTVGDWIRHSKLRAIKVGRDWRVSVTDLEAFADAHANIPTGKGRGMNGNGHRPADGGSPYSEP